MGSQTGQMVCPYVDTKVLVTQAVELAYVHGVVKRSNGRGEDAPDVVKITLWPSQFPKHQFDALTRVQPDFNLLIHKISQNKSFLLNSLEKIGHHDNFTRRLLEIYMNVNESTQKDITFGVHRCDYMLHINDDGEVESSPKLVELNTIAVSGFGFCQEVAQIHKLMQLQYQDKEIIKHYDGEIEYCDSESILCDAMALAWKEYGQQKAVILMAVCEDERNVYGQRKFESVMGLKHKIRMIRHTLTELYDMATVDLNGKLIVNGTEVAVVYYRTGYDPSHYPTEREWSARLLMERSEAIKCPSISYHLITTKKIQQVLANTGVLERLLDDPAMIERIRSTFVGQYSLEKDHEGDRVVEMTMKNPSKYVLKPQREGGGNNYFNDDVKEMLLELQVSGERAAYVLMDRINSPLQESVILDNTGYHHVEVNNEIGIFGVFLRSKNKVLLNTSAGHLVKSKPGRQCEGGNIKCSGALDSLILTS